MGKKTQTNKEKASQIIKGKLYKQFHVKTYDFNSFLRIVNGLTFSIGIIGIGGILTAGIVFALIGGSLLTTVMPWLILAALVVGAIMTVLSVVYLIEKIASNKLHVSHMEIMKQESLGKTEGCKTKTAFQGILTTISNTVSLFLILAAVGTIATGFVFALLSVSIPVFGAFSIAPWMVIVAGLCVLTTATVFCVFTAFVDQETSHSQFKEFVTSMNTTIGINLTKIANQSPQKTQIDTLTTKHDETGKQLLAKEKEYEKIHGTFFKENKEISDLQEQAFGNYVNANMN